METNKQPTPKAMKTPKFHFLALIIPTATLLLSDCASTGSDQPKAFGSRASPTLFREPVSSRVNMAYPFEALFEWEQSEISENSSASFTPTEFTINEPEEPDMVQIAPLVVTGSTFPDLTTEDWPSDVVEAELKAAWISPKESDTSRRHTKEDSVSEWMRSLR